MASGEGDPLRGVSSMATGRALAELAETYQRRSRQRVTVETIGGVEAARRAQAGEPLDFVVLAAEALGKLMTAGSVDPARRIDFARSGIAIAVEAGASRPDVSSESAVRDAVLQARSIGYSTGPSGDYVVKLFERWGIAGAIAGRIVQAPPGVPVGTLIVRGDVELGFQQRSELMHLPGIDIVGPLPPEIQLVTVFAAAVCTASTQPEAAMALLGFLASTSADAVKRRHGLEPARGAD